ncbi:MAG: SUMF1/EgtB/PvdO family nonheme iron enzyme, partial [Anaerolineae bacterium]|nr:SUMF1/EgtB/PvdO family nonheme iron enzyme [Anaerolineae bacterium]
QKALAKQPNTRFQSAGEMVAAFRIAITGAMPPGLESTDPPGERTAPLAAVEAVRLDTLPVEKKDSGQGRRGILTVGAVGLLLFLGIAAILLSGRGGGEVLPDTTAPVIAVNPTETATPSATPTLISTVTASPTVTFTASATDTTVPTATVTETAAPSLTPSETLDPVAAAETLFFGGLTQTATLWTATPTETLTSSPNFTETVGARLTEIAVASYTKTPSPTLTLSPSVIASISPPSVSIGDLTSTALYLSGTAVGNLSARPDVTIRQVLLGTDPIVLDGATHLAVVPVTVIVTNVGDAPAPTFEVSIRLSDGSSFSARTALILDPNAKGIVRLMVTFTADGVQQVMVVVDGDGAIPNESDRSNNQMTLEVMVNPPTPEVPTPIPAGTSNTVWTPQSQGFDGVEMVLVPAGCFMMGSDSGESDERPVHEVCFDRPFWIDKYEVFQAEFKKFGGSAARASGFTSDSVPVEQITWFEARDFCTLRGARLPTEAEWEYAARGPEGLIYPWGNDFVADNVTYALNSFDMTNAGGSHGNGRSWVGAQDMIGNVAEWTSSLYQPYPYQTNDGREADTGTRTDVFRVIRGGSWNDRMTDLLRATYRSNFDTPDGRTNSRGFRCVRSYEATESLSLTPTPIAAAATPIPAGTSNQVWAPVERDFNGVSMVLVPAGCFMMGSDSGGDEEKPVHEVCFDQPFWIDRTEVTQAQFKQFGGKASAESSFTGDDRPRENITWAEAMLYCVLRDSSLPSEAQWEYAARGPEGLIYPWGNDFVGDRANYCDSNCSYDWTDKAVDDGYPTTAPAGSYRNGASWVGALDMSGNVWEWTSSLYQPYPYQRDDGRESVSDLDQSYVLRGGSWGDDAITVRTAARRGIPSKHGLGLGFRCARTYDEVETVSTLSTPIPAGTSNTVWTPQTQGFDGVMMVLVPAGCFMMGSDSGDSDEKPVHEICFDQPFWIDQTEVTQGQFKGFGGNAANASSFTGDNLPVKQITWFEARDFCALRGARLPTEAEWEYAARGPEGLIYPWGNTFVADNVVYEGNSNNQPAAVDSRPGGVSWVGALDMSGNVWEWVSDWYDKTFYTHSLKSNPEGASSGTYRVLRGGAFSYREDVLRAANRFWVSPENGLVSWGVRCARSYN